jgi:hypothetical protein
MTATHPAQDTTLVTLPDIGLDTLRGLVAQLQADRPDDRDRIARGLQVLLTAEIRTTAELGVYLIQSCADSGTYYRATALNCCCPDRQRRTRECKHSYALQLLSCARAEASWQQVTTRYTLTAKGRAVLDDWRLPCPAPCPLDGLHPCRPAAALKLVGRA